MWHLYAHVTIFEAVIEPVHHLPFCENRDFVVRIFCGGKSKKGMCVYMYMYMYHLLSTLSFEL